MSVGDDNEHNAKAASERPSTSQKASTLSGKQKRIASLQSIQEKEYDSDAEDNLITAEEDERLITKEKLALLAPQLFSAPGGSRSDEHRSRTSVFLELRDRLVAQDNQILQSIPEQMKDLVATLLNRATSITLSQKDLALIREAECNNANHALA